MKNGLRFLAVALVAGGTMFAQSRPSNGIMAGGFGPGSYRPPTDNQPFEGHATDRRIDTPYVDHGDSYRDTDGDRAHRMVAIQRPEHRYIDRCDNHNDRGHDRRPSFTDFRR